MLVNFYYFYVVTRSLLHVQPFFVSSCNVPPHNDASRSPEPLEGRTFISYFKTMSLGLRLAKPLFSGRDMLLHRRSLVFVAPALTTQFFRLFRQVST